MSSPVLLSGPQSQPWFPAWNHELLVQLYRVWPFSHLRVATAEIFILNPWMSTLPFALVYYLSWNGMRDEVTKRKQRLLEIPLTCVVAVAVTAVMRPWVAWPSPSHAPDFQSLYPAYLWAYGNENCFPSHSTLICLIVALGLFPLHRKIGALLVAFVFIGLSLPRIYVGGHYPIDVAASVVLAIVCYFAVRALGSLPRVQAVLSWAASRGVWSECAVFLWSFELGDGFRGTLMAVKALRQLARFFSLPV
jgi:membrane-associated phospholipid phosphatase